jgi:hypothetical protein
MTPHAPGLVVLEKQGTDHHDFVVGRRGQSLDLTRRDDGQLGIDDGLDIEDEEGVRHLRSLLALVNSVKGTRSGGSWRPKAAGRRPVGQ